MLGEEDGDGLMEGETDGLVDGPAATKAQMAYIPSASETAPPLNGSGSAEPDAVSIPAPPEVSESMALLPEWASCCIPIQYAVFGVMVQLRPVMDFQPAVVPDAPPVAEYIIAPATSEVFAYRATSKFEVVVPESLYQYMAVIFVPDAGLVCLVTFAVPSLVTGVPPAGSPEGADVTNPDDVPSESAILLCYLIDPTRNYPV